MSEGFPLPAPVDAPKRIGKYRILRQIAQGGMAEIYLASASGIEGFEKLCVLKRILPLLATNHEFVQMFLDEARIAASLQHSNIAQVFDIGSENGSYYFVMEFLRGEDVRHILQGSVGKKAFIAYEHTVSTITGVCAALHYAHEMRGKDGKPLSLVHRDISPQNVFVTHDGSVKLCDFGIAKSAAQLTETRVGTLKGKIRYMSPEQCRSEPLDRRSDIFALSIVLWEMITLRRLFNGKSDFEIFKAIVDEPTPPPSGFRDDVPRELEAIVMKGLSPRREDRYQTAQEMQIALEDWARADRVPASPVRLAAFMTELFGAPAQTVETFLERATESDPLAKRIKKLNEREGSDSELVENEKITSKNPRPIDRKTDEDAEETSASGPRDLHPPIESGGPRELSDGSMAAELEPSVDLARPAPRLLVAGAVLACIAAVVLLALRGPTQRPRDLLPTTPVSASIPTAPIADHAKAVATAPTTMDGLRVPLAPLVEPARPDPRTVAVNPPETAPAKPGTITRSGNTRTNAPPVRRSAAKKSDLAKKREALDDLLPP